MRKQSKSCIPFLLLFSFALGAGAYAGERSYRFELFGGVNIPGSKDFEITSPQSMFPIPGQQKFSNGARGGVRVGKDWGRHWGMDYDYSYGTNTGSIATSYARFGFMNRIHQVSANILVYPCGLEQRHLFPYITGGMGAMFVTLSQKTIGEANDPLRGGIGPLSDETLPAFNAGAGVQIRVTNRVGVRVDVRNYMSRPLRYGLPKSSSDPNAVVLPVSDIFHQLVATIGIVFYF